MTGQRTAMLATIPPTTRADPLAFFEPFALETRGFEPAEAFAGAVIRAICGAGVTPSVGRRTAERCLRALITGSTARMGFRHLAKAGAIDHIWMERERLYGAYLAADDKLAALDDLPWIGPVTKRRLAEQFGLLAHTDDHRLDSVPVPAAA